MDHEIRISISTDNDAFGVSCEDTANEVILILRDAIKKINKNSYELFSESEKLILRDSNGNRVGEITYGVI